MQDLSKLAKNSMWPTSQAGGNMLAGNEEAMTAPGSAPVDNLNFHVNQVFEVPEVEDSNAKQIPPATSGKPQASGQQGKKVQSSPAWKKTTVPDVIRDNSGATAARDKHPGATVPLPTQLGNQ